MYDTPTARVMDELASAVAALLPGTWTLEPRTHASIAAVLAGDNDARVSFGFVSGAHDRARIVGLTPPPPAGEPIRLLDGNHTITVNRHRDPAIVAREIERRLLPAYLMALDSHQAQIKAKAEAAESRARAAAVLLSLAPAAHPLTHNDTIQVYRTPHTVSVRLNSDGSAAYELDVRNLPMATLLRVWKILAADEPPTVDITRDQIEAWAGRTLTDAEIDRLDDAIPNSSIPDAIGTIVDSLKG